jgi:peptide-methionine (S)-S-oxide reductase
VPPRESGLRPWFTAVCRYSISRTRAYHFNKVFEEKGENDMTDNVVKPETEKAIFAGGCFWCMEAPFEKLPGVISVISGYTGGILENPTYAAVSSGGTGHAEAVEITFDPEKISYQKLLDVFWMNIDPTAVDRQFVDAGHQYRAAVFYLNDAQKKLAEESRDRLQKSGRFKKPIVTEITKASRFYPAEEYHQGYYKKNPLRYQSYRSGSGRDHMLDGIWGKDRK